MPARVNRRSISSGGIEEAGANDQKEPPTGRQWLTYHNGREIGIESALFGRILDENIPELSAEIYNTSGGNVSYMR